MHAWVAQTESADDLEQVCGTSPSWICESLFDLTDGNRFLARIVDDVVSVVVIVVVAWIVAALARRYFARVVARMVAPDRTVASRQLARISDRASSFMAEPIGLSDAPDPRRAARLSSISAVVGSTATVIVWSVALVMMMGEVGFDLGPMIAGLGIAGVALGFGAQSLVKDCIAGLFMLIEDQYGIGDVVDLDEATGVVERISLRTTVLRGLDGTVWHVPNGEVQRVGNKSQLWSVAVIDVDVAYDSDLAAARQVIVERTTEVCAREEWVGSVLDEPNLLGVEALGADGITIRMTVKTVPGAQWALQRALREEIKAALDGAGIEIPFPQRTVWVRRDGSPESPPTDDPFDPTS
ncbi:MAG TPA: mechanosensitive ion channel family protein [Ilumatobacteraceae bacterium]|nr:mechanosensitive ion channel family protein [Ilumatobacteraceae bacterium]